MCPIQCCSLYYTTIVLFFIILYLLTAYNKQHYTYIIYSLLYKICLIKISPVILYLNNLSPCVQVCLQVFNIT